MSSKRAINGDSPTKPGSNPKTSSSINPPVPILNIPNPGGSTSSKSPNPVVSSTSVEAAQNRDGDEPEIMVLDDDEEMDTEVGISTIAVTSIAVEYGHK